MNLRLRDDFCGDISIKIENKLKSLYLKSLKVYSPVHRKIKSSNSLNHLNDLKCRSDQISSLTSEKTSNFKSLMGGKSSKKRILILISDTGGGHRASAQAIDQAINNAHRGKVDISVLDIWTDYANYPFNKFVPTYRFLAKYPILWRGFYAYGAFPPTKLFTEIWSKFSSYNSFKDAIIERDPDLVVSMHPLCQLMPLSIVSEMNKNRDPAKFRIPFVTIVTDLGEVVIIVGSFGSVS